MARIFLRWGRILLISSLTAGTLFGLLMGIRSGVGGGVLAGLLFGLSWGPLLVLVIAPLDAIVRWRFPSKSAEPHQHREVIVLGEADGVFQSLERLAVKLPMLRRVQRSPAARTLEATTKRSWKSSFGETITIRVNADAPGKSRVAISSRPRWRMTLVDYGKNWQNVETIARALQRHRSQSG